MNVRYAPSPTGILHVGNLRTAWISHAIARALSRPWRVRFEDIDTPRVVAGAIERQLSDLRSLRLVPDTITIQSEYADRHRGLFELACRSGVVYPCTCSRKEIQAELEGVASAPHTLPAVYHGQCRESSRRNLAQHETIAWRFLNPEDPSGRHDFIIGRTQKDHRGFVPAYHWACAIDDHDGECFVLVRASDLAHATAYQRLIHRWLSRLENTERPCPAVFQTSLVTTNEGHRLEKRTTGVTLQELLKLGWTAESLTERFAESFDSSLITRIRPEAVLGEARTEILLQDLLH